jgi:hypothetical protein
MNTRLGHANRCRHPITILRLASFIVLSGLLGTTCLSVTAQEQPPGKLPKTIETRKTSPSNLDDPQSAGKRAQQILALKDKLLQLTQDGSNETSKAEMGVLTEALARAALSAQFPQSAEKNPEQLARALQFLQMKQPMDKNPEQPGQAEQLQQMREQLVEREKQMAMLLAEQRKQALAPLENGQLKVYSLGAVPARAAAQTIESLFGAQVLRIAVDERSNSLIVYGKSDSLPAVDALLSRLDEAAPAAGREKSKQGTASAPKSVLLRVFWLADGQPQGIGQNPADFLPKSVLQATNKLGLEAPRLVSQTVNSLAVGREEAVNFATNVPAVLLNQPAGLDCDGRLKLVSDDRVQLEMHVIVNGPAANCELRGSLATPLGHYMVLGTANSLLPEGGATAGATNGGPGMGPGRPQSDGRFGAVRPGGGFRGAPEGEPGAGRAAGPEGGAGPGAAEGEVSVGPGTGGQAAKPNFKSSRFAFVVQVIEGQSYPADPSSP